MNKDVGFVKTGQPAEVKVDAFNFTEYGVIHGAVEDLSDDSIQDKQLGLVYKTRVALKKDGLQVGDRWRRLTPGMSVSVEVMTGKRRLIEYFLSPLLKYVHGSVKER